jgi:hypothetical protein
MWRFKYLGTKVTNINCFHEWIKGRIKSCNVCYHSVKNIRILAALCVSVWLSLTHSYKNTDSGRGLPACDTVYFTSLHPEDGGSMVLRNVGVLTQYYTASHSRGPRLESSTPWKRLRTGCWGNIWTKRGKVAVGWRRLHNEELHKAEDLGVVGRTILKWILRK